MNKRMKMFNTAIFALTMTLVGIAYADNVEIKLGSGDGFKVLDSSGSPLMDITSSGNVGIGTSSPSTKLDVSGTVTATSFSGGGMVPSGMIAFFASSCPSGWIEYTALQGRFVVGTKSGGTNAGTVGTALSDLGNKTINQVVAHTHTIDPPNTDTNTTGAHTHTDMGLAQNIIDALGAFDAMDNNGSHNTGSDGDHLHAVDIASFTSGSTGNQSVDVTMPYIQLTACQAP